MVVLRTPPSSPPARAVVEAFERLPAAVKDPDPATVASIDAALDADASNGRRSSTIDAASSVMWPARSDAMQQGQAEREQDS